MPSSRPIVTERVLTAIMTVRDTGLTNMYAQQAVAEIAHYLDRDAARAIARMDPGDYLAGIVFGFSVAPATH